MFSRFSACWANGTRAYLLHASVAILLAKLSKICRSYEMATDFVWIVAWARRQVDNDYTYRGLLFIPTIKADTVDSLIHDIAHRRQFGTFYDEYGNNTTSWQYFIKSTTAGRVCCSCNAYDGWVTPILLWSEAVVWGLVSAWRIVCLFFAFASAAHPVTLQPQPQIQTQAINVQNAMPTSVSVAGSMAPTPANTNNAKEKCRKFLSNLLELSSREPPPVEQNVQELIQELIDANVEPDEFCNRLERLLNASPQPCLIGFLKKSLPLLRQSLYLKELTIEGIKPPSHAVAYGSFSPQIAAQVRPVVPALTSLQGMHSVRCTFLKNR